MKTPIGCLSLTLILCLVPIANSQEDSVRPPASEDDIKLPHDKTPEQLLALVALKFGISETKNGANDRAIRYFIQSKRLDPELTNARLYLGTAYASKYAPGDIGEENLHQRDAAAQEFRGVLQKDPENLSAIDGLGSILFYSANATFDTSKYGEPKELFVRHTRLAPGDAEPHYWVGVIDWTIAYGASKAVRAQFNESHKDKPLPDTEPIPAELRKPYSTEFGPMVDEGIDEMKKAIALRADYDDAMAYLNLLYRRKADIVASEIERTKLLKMADDLIDQVKEIKQKRATPKQ